jgi:TetR/AcrR family transcriptional repressor of nem operon
MNQKTGISDTPAKPSARAKLLAAAMDVIRRQGYAATSVDALCDAAGVTKGAFFHHFKSKEDLAVAAADHWSQTTTALFAAAPYHAHRDPLERVLGYIDFRRAILVGEIPEFTCLAGTMVQETYASNPAIRDGCAQSIIAHAEIVEADIAAAIAQHGLTPVWTAKSLALYMQAVLQGGFILAKATGSAQAAGDAIDHLRRYVKLLFETSKPQEDAA